MEYPNLDYVSNIIQNFKNPSYSTKNPENSRREMEILNMVIASGDMSGAALIADNWHTAKAKKVT